MPEVFSVSLRPRQSSDPKNPIERAAFDFELKENVAPDLLAESLKLRREIESTNLAMFTILRDVHRLDLYESYVMELYAAAKSGFQSHIADLSLGWYLVSKVQSDLINEVGGKIRLRYILHLSRVCFILGTLGLACGLALSFAWGPYLESWMYPPLFDKIRAATFVLFGCCLSVWLSSMLRNRQVRWANLTLFDPHGFSPTIRVILVCAITFVFCLLLMLDVVSIGFGGTQLKEFLNVPALAILVGLIGGLSEDAVTNLIVGRIGQLAEPTPTRPVGP